jgi:nucleoside-diphosphate-sugar epimerase
MEKAKILITGGAGYIGSVLCPALLAEGHSVTVLDNFSRGDNTLAACCSYDGFNMLRGDCRDEQTMAPLVRDADLVIPLAALVGAPLCDRDKLAAISTNRDAVTMLTRILSPDQRMILPMTNSGYGVGESGKFCTEESPLRPISLYGTTKVEAENAVLSRPNGLTFRLATVFGMSPRMRLDLLVNDFVYRAVTDRSVVIFEGHFKRNYIHIRDVVGAFLHAIRNFDTMKNRPYNAGLEEANLSKIELCEVIKKFIPRFCYFEGQIGGDVDKRDYIVSNARILATGFRTEWPLERGIAELMKGYRGLSNSRYSNV